MSLFPSASVITLRRALSRPTSPLPTLTRAKSKSKDKAPAPAPKQKTGSGPPSDLPGDNQTEAIRRELYPATQPKRSSDPWCPPRPDRLEKLSLAIPSPEAHETITRAHHLHSQLAHNARKRSLQYKLDTIFAACEELRLGSKTLYDLASKDRPVGVKGLMEPVAQGRNKTAGLFPREMMLPTDSPSKEGWDYDWEYIPEVDRKA